MNGAVKWQTLLLLVLLDASLPANYRPISNLNNISKILEKLFMARLQPHIVSNPDFNQLYSPPIDRFIPQKLPCFTHWTPFIAHLTRADLQF